VIKFKKKLFPIEYIIWGILIYTFSYNILYSIDKYIGHVFGLVGVLIAFISIKYPKYKPLKNGETFFLFYTLLIWLFIVYIRGFFSPNATNAFIDFVSNRKGIVAYLTPCILFFGIRSLNIRTIFRLCYISVIIGILYALINFKEIYLISHVSLLTAESWAEMKNEVNMGQIPGYFILPGALILMCYDFISKRKLRVVWFGFFLSLGAAVAYGRRSYIAFHVLYVLCIGYIYFTSKKSSFGNKILIFSIIAVAVATVVSSFADISFFNVIGERFGSDTRSGVESYMLNDFQGKPLDWIFGRGYWGRYYCPLNIAGDTSSYRDLIETGYLQFILKGGVLLLALYVILILRAAYLGFFRSKNTIVKAMSLFLITKILFLYSGNTLEFSLSGIVTWICVAFCYSDVWRNRITDSHIYKII